MLDMLVKNARLHDGSQVDIGVQDEKLAAIQPEILESAKLVLDADGLQLLSGTIDIHVHFNEPGNQDWEGIFTGSRAFAAGGGCLFVDMPLNSVPTTLDRESLNAKLYAMRQSQTDFALWGGLTSGNLEHLPELALGGVAGFKAFMSDSGLPEFPHVTPDQLQQGMEVAAGLNLPVAVHAEDPASLGQATSIHDFADSRPLEAETRAVQLALDAALSTGCHVHLVHLSNIESVQLALEARAKGTRVSIETCPHYLFFNREDLIEQGTLLKCAPPLRDEIDRKMLLKALQKGWIDTVGSDHSPAPPGMKKVDFLEAWGGISSVQTTLFALLTLGLPADQVMRLLSEHPARVMGFAGKGRLEVGLDADFVLLDPAVKVLEAAELHDRHRLNPYLSRPLLGRVLYNFVRGHPVYERGQFCSFTPRHITPLPAERQWAGPSHPAGPAD